jgi:hypothetical protein
MYSSDAYRAIELVPRFARILGWACAVLGTIGVGVVVADVDGRIPNGMRVVAAATVAVIMIVPGILYVGFADAMARRRRWAVITVLVLACVQTLLLAGDLVMSLLSKQPGGSVFVSLALLILAGLLIFNCARSFPALRSREEPQSPRASGFEPVMPGIPPPHVASSFPTPPKSLKGPRKTGPEA